MTYELTPTAELEPGEKLLASFRADRATYWRNMATLAAIAMAAGMAILWAIGNPHVWTGGIGGLAAIALRGWYVASDEMGVRWDLTDRRLMGPGGRVTGLSDIAKVRSLGSAVQVVTVSGDKHLIKYMADPAAIIAQINGARGRA
ncbi:MAG: hypothetical protein HLUCCA08_00775 [Rhodobacteraceae bacterium HLUCCA08]|nr:MAG: hypothetical protein HLUCCA08_00775 [Rhodobacteraceae bacterium HLUCCA08]